MMLLIAALALSTAMAVPALNKPLTFKQSDGSEITVRLIGDEHFNTYITLDQLTLERVGDDFYYKTATGASTVMAHNEGSRTQQEASFIAANRDMMTLEKTIEARATSTARRAPAKAPGLKATQVPCVGSPNIPIILVGFSDYALRNGANAVSIFESQFNTMNKSALQYFKDNSHGQFTPNFEILGAVTLPNTRAYYGKMTSYSNDAHLGQMVAEAVQMYPDVDWSRYDNDKDGFADVVIVLFAGPSEAQGASTNALWPCQWDLYSASLYDDGPGTFKMGDTEIYKFAIFNEISGVRDTGTATDGIGTFCHEFSHCLGLRDLYDTGTGGYYGMGNWSIMCAGNYNGVVKDGDTPCAYTAYEKNVMGWMALTPATVNTQYSLKPIDGVDGEAIKITNSENSNEYYILECRKKQGWNAVNGSEGLLAYHVTYDANAWSNSTINNNAMQRFTPICADNRWGIFSENGDCYPYGNNNKITDSSTPAATLNLGTRGFMGLPITDITKTSTGVSFWFCKDYERPVPTIAQVEEPTITIGSLTCQWNAIDNSVYYTLNAYSDDHSYDKTFDKITTNSQEVTGLTPGTRYNLRVKATYTDGTQGEWSQVATATTKSNPVMQKAAQVGDTEFTASWQPLDNVASYTLHVRNNAIPDYALLLHETFDKCTTTSTTNIASNLNKYTDNEGWTGAYVYQNVSGVSLASTTNAGRITSPALDFSSWEGKVVVKVTAACMGTGTDYPLQIAVDGTSQSITIPDNTAQEYTLVYNTSGTTAGKVIFSASAKKKIVIYDIRVYSGNGEDAPQAAPSLAPIETGDQDNLTITGITDSSYTVKNLVKGNEYAYRVMALFTNGSESQWSNVESVRLGSSLPGDVNGDGTVDISDVDCCINVILGSEPASKYEGRADVNGDGAVDIADVNAIINIILG